MRGFEIGASLVSYGGGTAFQFGRVRSMRRKFQAQLRGLIVVRQRFVARFPMDGSKSSSVRQSRSMRRSFLP